MMINKTEDSLLKFNETTLNDSEILGIDPKIFISNYNDSILKIRKKINFHNVEINTDTFNSHDKEHE